MAYIANNLVLAPYGGGGGAAKTFIYVTTDAIATVMASGYFSPLAGLNIGDVIEVRVVDAVSVGSRAAATGVQRIIVATNDLTTVTTTVEGLSSGGIVVTTATTLTITRALHHNRTVLVNSAAPIAITLPQALATGSKYRFVIGVAATGTGHTIKVANATDVMTGQDFCVTTTSTNAEGFATSATSDTITVNGTTLGGVVGDQIEIEDIATGIFSVKMFTSPTGTEATPFSATV